MTQWHLTSGDILDIECDALVCSANPFLTLSGGVGGAFLIRYGDEMQTKLNDLLAAQGTRHVPRGTIVEVPPCGSPYQAVYHAVAVDGWYESSVEVVTAIVGELFENAAARGSNSLAIPALATGYGKLTKREFATAIRPFWQKDCGIQSTTICLRDDQDMKEVQAVLESPTD